MNMKSNFTNQNQEYKPCMKCAERIVHWSEGSTCMICKEDEKIHSYLAPFPPEGQQLDDHLFPITQKETVLTSTYL